MLKLLINHIIGEIIIDVFFNTLFNNFIKPTIIENIRRIIVKERKLKSIYTLETQHDIMSPNRIEPELYDIIKEEVYRELNDTSSYTLSGYKGSPISEISPIIFAPFPSEDLK